MLGSDSCEGSGQLLNDSIGHGADVSKRPCADDRGGGGLEHFEAIEGIEHRIDFAGGHTTRVFTSPTTIVTELILDDANNGILDTNVLG